MPAIVAHLAVLAIVAWQGGQGQQNPQRRIACCGSVHLGKLLAAPKPELPRLAAIAHVHGPVRIEAVIDTDGTIAKLHVLSGHPFLIAAAMEAAKRYRYEPVTLNGTPVQMVTIITIDFKQEAEPYRSGDRF